MEQSVILAKPEQTKELGLKPTLVKDVVLISPGIWTGIDGQATNYSAETILNGFQNTNWDNMNLFLDHKDSQGPAVGNWAGFIRNPRMLGSDLIGDVEVWHPMISMFIKDAKAKFAVSMTTVGAERMLASGLCDYEIDKFESFSMVHDPGCKISWLPKALASGKETKTIVAGSFNPDAKKELQAGKFNCECIKCGNKMFSEKHCSEITCSKCGGQMRREERPGPGKELANPTQKKINEKEYSEDIKSKKEVKKMKSEKEETKAVEDKKEVVDEKETEGDKKELAEAKESETVKALGAKVDAISSDMKELTSVVKELASKKEAKKELAEGDAKEAVADEADAKEAVTDEAGDESKKELANTKSELEETKKELASLKEDDSPDKKSLAIGGSGSHEIDATSANLGMLGFLKENANLKD